MTLQVCKACYEDHCPIIPYGTGTGLEAGISALYGGVCIDLSKMDEIHDYNPEDFDVKVISKNPNSKSDFINVYYIVGGFGI